MKKKYGSYTRGNQYKITKLFIEAPNEKIDFSCQNQLQMKLGVKLF